MTKAMTKVLIALCLTATTAAAQGAKVTTLLREGEGRSDDRPGKVIAMDDQHQDEEVQ